jgi:hypothetical protein
VWRRSCPLWSGCVEGGEDFIGELEDGDSVELSLRLGLFGDDRRGLLLLRVAASGLIKGSLFRTMIAGGLFGRSKLSTGRCADDDGQEAEQRCAEVKSFFHRCEV